MTIPEVISFWNEVHTIIDDAMQKRDRSVSIYISPEYGNMSVIITPWPDEESLREAYNNGEISYNDYRAKIGLSPVKSKTDII